MIQVKPYFRLPDGTYQTMTPYTVNGFDGALVEIRTHTGLYDRETTIDSEEKAHAFFEENAHFMFLRTVPIVVTNCVDEKEYQFDISLADMCRLILRNLERESDGRKG